MLETSWGLGMALTGMRLHTLIINGAIVADIIIVFPMTLFPHGQWSKHNVNIRQRIYRARNGTSHDNDCPHARVYTILTHMSYPLDYLEKMSYDEMERHALALSGSLGTRTIILKGVLEDYPFLQTAPCNKRPQCLK